jgi:short subunit dehydrogenase-like uncharacterized protein
MKKGWFKVTNITSSVPTAITPRTHVKSTIYGRGDPGYLATAGKSPSIFISLPCTNLFVVMISESALALVFDTPKLPALARRGGVLTPMSALGDVLIERLKDTGRFEFTSEIVPGTGQGEAKKTR